MGQLRKLSNIGYIKLRPLINTLLGDKEAARYDVADIILKDVRRQWEIKLHIALKLLIK